MTLVCQSLLGRCGITPSQSTRRCWAGSRAARAVGFEPILGPPGPPLRPKPAKQEVEARLRLMRMRMQLPGPGMQKIIIPNMLTAATSLAFFVFFGVPPAWRTSLHRSFARPWPNTWPWLHGIGNKESLRRIGLGPVMPGGKFCLSCGHIWVCLKIGYPPIPVVYHGLSWFIIVYHHTPFSDTPMSSV